MKIFLYSGTHWDREWYQSFQGFRHRLVETADKLVEGLETNQEYGIFHFDGQTIVLEDILEIAPDLEDRLGKLIRDGKIVIGPWYCMPDEVNISGESIIRNLQMGKEICHKWGVEPSGDAYICDIFGHIAQTPQIFAGMGLNYTVLGRGTNEHNHPMHFRWQAPDGTEVTVYKLSDKSGYLDIRVTADGDTKEEQVESFRQAFEEYAKNRVDIANIPVVMFFDAGDHRPWQGRTPRYVDALKRMFPETEVYHTNIMDMCAEVEKYHDQLPVISGELIETTKKPGTYSFLITNTLSSRYPIKKINDLLETRLEKTVQPLYAYGKACSRDGFLKLAQKYLIQNHPHDSICGCSIDQVHRDMMYRFDQSRMLVDEILERVRNSIKDGSFAKAEAVAGNSHPAKLVRIYNPLPYGDHRTLECEIHFEKKWGKYAEPFGYEDICKFKLYDRNGVELPYGISEIKTYPTEDVYTVSFEADLIPSGLTDIEVRPMEMPTRYLQRLNSTATSAENEVISVSVNLDGSICLTDKRTGVTYPKLLGIVDNGEIGDGWFHCAPAVDRVVTNTVASVEKCEDNVNRATFKITQTLRFPEAVDRSHFGIRRSERYVDVPVTHYVTLSRSENYLTVKTHVDNRACDHRMKLRLATGITGNTYYAGQSFAFVERETGRDMNTADWKEASSLEKNCNGMVVKRNGQGGLAFLSKHGLKECAVTEDGTIDMTLLRCYRKTVQTNGEPDGQLIGIHEFEYALVPLTREDTLASVARLNDQLKTELLCVTTEGNTGCAYQPGMEILGDTFLFSTANKLADGMEFRIYNCSEETETGVIRLPEGARAACLTEIDGRFLQELPVTDGKIELALGKWKIATVRVIF